MRQAIRRTFAGFFEVSGWLIVVWLLVAAQASGLRGDATSERF
jgi:hypothetical protein